MKLTVPYMDPAVYSLRPTNFDEVDHKILNCNAHPPYHELVPNKALFFLYKLLFIFDLIFHSQSSPFKKTFVDDSLTLSYAPSQYDLIYDFFSSHPISLKAHRPDNVFDTKRSKKRQCVLSLYLFKFIGFSSKTNNKRIISITLPSHLALTTFLSHPSFQAFALFLRSNPTLIAQPLSESFPSLLFTPREHPSHPPSPTLVPTPTTAPDSFIDPFQDIAPIHPTLLAQININPFADILACPSYIKLRDHSMLFNHLSEVHKILLWTELNTMFPDQFQSNPS